MLGWCLILLTIALFEKVEPYVDISAELLMNPSFQKGPAHWQISNTLNAWHSGAIRLMNQDRNSGVSLRQIVKKPTSGYVRLAADARLEGVVPGPEAWQKARIGLLGRESGGEWRWDFKGTLFSVDGDQLLRDCSTVIKIPDKYVEIRVEIELTGATGIFIVERVSLKEVEPRLIFNILAAVLLISWSGLLITLLLFLLRTPNRLSIVVALLIIFVLLLIPEGAKQSIQSALAIGDSNFPMDHLLLFSLSTLLVLFETEKHHIPVIQVIGGLVTFSVSTEVLQYFSSHRSPAVLDELTNLLGISVAMAIFRLPGFVRLSRNSP